MGDIAFRDWFPPLIAALAGGALGALVGGVVGWLGNARVQREARIARVQMDRKREIYQPLYQQVRQSHGFLRSDPFPNQIMEDPEDQSHYDVPSYARWTALDRQGRNAEASADVVEAFTQIQRAAKAYLIIVHRVRDKWYECGKAYAVEREKEQPPTVLPREAGLSLLEHVLQGGEITDSQPQYAVEPTLPGREIRGQELLQSIPDAHAEIQEVRNAARELRQAFASAEAALEKKIRYITEKYEGG